MNGYIVTIIIAFIFGPILALPVMFLGLFNIMDFALYSFPIFFFCIMGLDWPLYFHTLFIT
ncbi:hypothetical protein CI621_01240 [Klebsiella pneumoniae subsp. pneumoniae]|nr:hypothetical protein CI621_01240 [Klebsiella pneumoniae subsp. pneumoniae]THM67355.1 hypothetical protein FAO25_27455 [Klebsiella pneumoniae subsp. pneumoniae]